MAGGRSWRRSVRASGDLDPLLSRRVDDAEAVLTNELDDRIDA